MGRWGRRGRRGRQQQGETGRTRGRLGGLLHDKRGLWGQMGLDWIPGWEP